MDQKPEVLEKNGITYEVHREIMLGKGIFGTVFKGIRRTQDQSEEVVAVKEILKSSLFKKDQTSTEQLKMLERLKYEVVTWQMAQHPNIVRFLDFAETKTSCFFISEYCDGPTLEEVIKAGQTPEQVGLVWLKEIAGALSYLHSKNIIHRDIKPANIIFKNNTPKIVDFGFAKQVDFSQQSLTVGIGTPKYMAPEILSYRDDYQTKVDIWSLGWTFFEVFLKQDPYPTQNVRSMDDMLNSIGDNRITFPKNCNLSQHTVKILTLMLEVDEIDRCDHQELLRLLR